MLVNFSNHPSEQWCDAQLQAAKAYGQVIDLPFPLVDPWATSNDVERIAKEALNTIEAYKPHAVLCQGEFTLAYRIIGKLKERGIPVLAACSERNAVEKVLADGTTHKRVIFDFVRLREY